MITSLLIGVCCVFVLEFTIFLYGLKKSEKTKNKIEQELSASIIVAARNEEASIRDCLESLTKIEYPFRKLEIIIVNDQSTDRTESIIKEFVERDTRFRLVNAKAGKGHLIGKANALSQAIDISNGEIILFTDADCIVPPSWVKSTISHFAKDVGIVGGFTILKAENIFEGLQSLDWVFLYSVASAAATLGFPLTAVGNNLAVRRTAYDAVGGYSKIPFSVTEDYLLTREILSKTGLKMRFPLNKNTVILSRACSTLKQLYHQRKRWGIGALDMVTAGFFAFGIPFAFILILLISLLFTPLNLFLLVLGIKLIMEIIFTGYSLKRMGAIGYIKYFIFFEIYLVIYVLALPWVALLNRKVLWKDRLL
jgi:cellulose synthase/poly-beta-1,6-N-acetylglucosamine synthase-like glycosyltransferase